ncbi:hypothetical protein X759_28405 [Mesorhizobium sp. LSHC420B00]|uniref:hypothetical protein n=1 Tax=unclassified Mesorhizobium TaxID=325217 RepID=UPI0003CDEC4C|nr:hypothetical protein X759_28405 [Mesorhizobium sp. LSHC420B00]
MTTIRGQLLHMLQIVAEALGSDFRERLIFVGGCTTALFITDEVTLGDVRATDDVDLIVHLAGYADWAQLQEELRRRGFAETMTLSAGCLVDGRPEIADEVLGANAEIRQVIADQFAALLKDTDFDYFLEGNVRGRGAQTSCETALSL